MSNFDMSTSAAKDTWLRSYYFARAAFSVAWVAAALLIGQKEPAVGAVLLVLYPLWDAAANFLDAQRSGGLGKNRTQAVNLVVSLVTTVAVLATLPIGQGAVLTVFGIWAVLSGLLQLATAVRRWKTAGAQWAMILSGAQSALAGVFFVIQAQQPVAAVTATVAGYAGFGAVYFLVSALWLTVRAMRARGRSAA